MKVAIHAPPVDGKANDALTQFLARALGVSRASVTIKRGEKSREKTICVEGMTAEEAERIMADDSDLQKN